MNTNDKLEKSKHVEAPIRRCNLFAYDKFGTLMKNFDRDELQLAIDECRENGWFLQRLETIVSYTK